MSNFKNETYAKIAKNLRKLRTDSNVSQERLSEILDVNPKFIGHVERCERCISLKKLIKIAEYFNVDIKVFFE